MDLNLFHFLDIKPILCSFTAVNVSSDTSMKNANHTDLRTDRGIAETAGYVTRPVGHLLVKHPDVMFYSL